MNLRIRYRRVLGLEAGMEEEPPDNAPEPEVLVSVPVVEKPAARQSSRCRTEPVWDGLSPKVLHISVGKGFQQYGGKAHRSIMTAASDRVEDVHTCTDLEATAGVTEESN